MATRHNVLSIAESAKRLTLADGLGFHTVPNRMLWQGALVRSYRTNIPVYDTVFVELAIREQLPLATFDVALQRTFPDVARRPATVSRT